MAKEIKITSNPDQETLDKLDIFSWPTWEKEVSEFPWSYDQPETCYIVEGQVTVTPEGGQPVTIKQGDLVNFPQGLSCTWKITKPIKKHYLMG